MSWFVDDHMIVAENWEELKGALEGVKESFSKHPLKIMIEKAKVKLIGKQ